jgi:hypothetical protein
MDSLVEIVDGVLFQVCPSFLRIVGMNEQAVLANLLIQPLEDRQKVIVFALVSIYVIRRLGVYVDAHIEDNGDAVVPDWELGDDGFLEYISALLSVSTI